MYCTQVSEHYLHSVILHLILQCIIEFEYQTYCTDTISHCSVKNMCYLMCLFLCRYYCNRECSFLFIIQSKTNLISLTNFSFPDLRSCGRPLDPTVQ